MALQGSTLTQNTDEEFVTMSFPKSAGIAVLHTLSDLAHEQANAQLVTFCNQLEDTL